MTSAVDRLNKAARAWPMKPQCFIGHSIEMEVLDAGLDLEEMGYYCRLKGPGLGNATALAGPFASIEQAAEHLLRIIKD